MFQSILHRAESAIEASVGSAVVKALAVIPFLIAAGFGAAAFSHYLTPRYGPGMANLILAAIFVVVGVVAMIAAAYKYPAKAEADDPAPQRPAAGPEAGGGSGKMADADKDLLYSALTAMAPIALPRVAGMIIRNLPVIAALAAAAYLASRSSEGSRSQQASSPPAE